MDYEESDVDHEARTVDDKACVGACDSGDYVNANLIKPALTYHISRTNPILCAIIALFVYRIPSQTQSKPMLIYYYNCGFNEPYTYTKWVNVDVNVDVDVDVDVDGDGLLLSIIINNNNCFNNM